MSCRIRDPNSFQSKAVHLGSSPYSCSSWASYAHSPFLVSILWVLPARPRPSLPPCSSNSLRFTHLIRVYHLNCIYFSEECSAASASLACIFAYVSATTVSSVSLSPLFFLLLRASFQKSRALSDLPSSFATNATTIKEQWNRNYLLGSNNKNSCQCIGHRLERLHVF